MVTQDPTPENPADNLSEVAGLHVQCQPALNAIKIEIVDPRGRSVAFLLGPDQVIGLTLLLINAHRRLGRHVPPAGPLSSTF